MARQMRTRRTTSSMEKAVDSVKTKKGEVDSKEEVIEESKEEIIVEDVSVEKSEKKESKTVNKKEYSPEDGIACRAVNVGKTFFIGPKSSAVYEFAFKGEVIEIEYRDLVTAVRQNSSQIYRPFFVIEDKDFVSQFPKLQEFYNNMYDVSDAEEILRMNPTMIRRTLKGIPDGLKDAVKSTAISKIADGTLDSIQVIKTLDDIFGTKLMLMTGLFNDEDDVVGDED